VANFLTTHFTLEECERTTHETLGNKAPDEAITNLIAVCTELAEPTRTRWGPLYVSSGYRSIPVNAAVGGAPDSAHLYGCALDLVPLTAGVTVDQMMKWVIASGLPFDQAIDEETPSGHHWIHLAVSGNGKQRHMALAMRNGVYTPWNA
jgi:Peptidase M15